MLPLALRPGRFPRVILESARRDGVGWTPAELDAYLSVLPAAATRRLYGAFLIRELLTVRGGRLVVVDGAGHFLPEQAPELVARRIREAD
jgi:pimeloyl-ACP methyl ester carboxylesterase